MRTHWSAHQTPLGTLTLLAGHAGLTGLRFPGPVSQLEQADHDPAAFTLATQQLDQYLAGDRERFDVALDLHAASELQRAVWRELFRIPYASTITHAELTEAIEPLDRALDGAALAYAVLIAIVQAPVPIIIPNHRVIATDQGPIGYTGGDERRRALLDLEARAARGLAPDELTYREVELAQSQSAPQRQFLAAPRGHVLQHSRTTPNTNHA